MMKKHVILFLLTLFSCGICMAQQQLFSMIEGFSGEPSEIPVYMKNEMPMTPVEIEELALLRNEVFARKGYIFKNHQYQDYFENQQWYTVHLMRKCSL